MNYKEEKLISEIFTKSISGAKGVEALRFRADHRADLDLLDELENRQYIENVEGYYYVRLVPLFDLSKRNNAAKHIFFLCELLFRELHRLYLESPSQPVILNNLADRADLQRSDVNKALKYMIQSSIFGGYTTRFFAVEGASVTPSERILRFNSFEEVVEDIKKMQWAPKSADQPILEEASPFNNHRYINSDRIEELRNLHSSYFDFKRLIKICEEINTCAQEECYLALGAMVRSLLDHVPPIFGQSSFKQAASNHRGGKSIKKSFEYLEHSSRNIADNLLHQQIRKAESLPNINQVNFSPDIDVLLSEIIRVTCERNA